MNLYFISVVAVLFSLGGVLHTQSIFLNKFTEISNSTGTVNGSERNEPSTEWPTCGDIVCPNATEKGYYFCDETYHCKYVRHETIRDVDKERFAEFTHEPFGEYFIVLPTTTANKELEENQMGSTEALLQSETTLGPIEEAPDDMKKIIGGVIGVLVVIVIAIIACCVLCGFCCCQPVKRGSNVQVVNVNNNNNNNNAGAPAPAAAPTIIQTTNAISMNSNQNCQPMMMNPMFAPMQQPMMQNGFYQQPMATFQQPCGYPPQQQQMFMQQPFSQQQFQQQPAQQQFQQQPAQQQFQPQQPTPPQFQVQTSTQPSETQQQPEQFQQPSTQFVNQQQDSTPTVLLGQHIAVKQDLRVEQTSIVGPPSPMKTLASPEPQHLSPTNVSQESSTVSDDVVDKQLSETTKCQPDFVPMPPPSYNEACLPQNS